MEKISPRNKDITELPKNVKEISFIVDRAGGYLRTFDVIEFAVLFGSFAANKATTLSDVDIGVFTGRELSLPELGLLSTNLEAMLKRRVDLAVLNNLQQKNPVLAYEIMCAGRLIFVRNDELFVSCKRDALLQFMDTGYLRTVVDRAFQERLQNNRFGESNYVGTSQTARR